MLRIEVTDKAREKLLEVLKDKEGQYVRVLLQGVG